MIIDSSQKEIEVVGDIKEFKTSIDPKNLEFITTLLSSNLYSNPEKSFIREIVSNAWDSHVEAGTTDTPVIISFKNFVGETIISIRDFGTGISPERFKDIYCNIGSSTKRESNDFIGGFGIGKYSALACSSSVYITSYYNGTEYRYIMLKSGNCITTNLVGVLNTSEKNGVKVEIHNIFNKNKYIEALKDIVFFPNIYIDGIVNNINDTKVKYLKNIGIASISIKNKILLGNVLYPCDSSLLSQNARNFITTINNTGIVLKFNVGELNITPNRESIIYTTETLKKIEDKIIEAKEEIYEKIRSFVEKDYDNIYEYSKVISRSLYYEPFENKLGNSYSYSNMPIFLTEFKDLDITYRKENLRDYGDYIYSIFNRNCPYTRAVIGKNGKIYKDKIPNKYYNLEKLNNPKILIIDSNQKFTRYVKEYLSIYYKEYLIIGNLTKEIILKSLERDFNNQLDNQKLKVLGKAIHDYIIEKAIKLDLSSDTKFLEYKKEQQDSLKSNNIRNMEEVILRIVNGHYKYKDIRNFSNIDTALKYMKGLKKGIILLDMKSNIQDIESLAMIKDYALIQAKKSIVNYISSLNLSYIVDIDWLMYKDKNLNKLAAILRNIPGENIMYIDSILYWVPEIYIPGITEVNKLYKKYGINSEYKRLATRDTIESDSYYVYLCEKINSFIELHKEFKSIIARDNITNNTYIIAALIKSKKSRVNSKAYRDYKNNKLIKILCKK